MAWNIEEALSYYEKLGAPKDQSALISLLREIQTENSGSIPTFLLARIADVYHIKESFLLAVIKRIPSLRLGNRHCLELCAGPNCGKHTDLAAYAEKIHSLSGKALIHSAGKNDKTYQWADDDTTAQCFADAAKAAMNYKKGRWVFINVLDAFEAEDKCVNVQDRKSVGILASADPVALDQACVDFEFGAAKDDATRAAWEKHHSVNVLEFAEKINVGKRHYRMVSVD